MPIPSSVSEILKKFAEAVKTKLSQTTQGEPEEQLRTPFENLITDISLLFGMNVVCTGETNLPDRMGRPDFAIHQNDVLTGFVELKAIGIGANISNFKGHNRRQWKRFSAIPNILYTDGNEWALYRDGERVGALVRLSGDVATDGGRAVEEEDGKAIERLLKHFFAWEPFIPTDRSGRINLKSFAELLAPLTRLLRDDVIEALKDPDSPLARLADDWRQLLFPDASDEQFADSYAQTVAFALLLGRSEGADPLTLANAEATLAAQHNLLSRALQVFTDPGAYAEMFASLELLLRVISATPIATFTGSEDPWLYFYEDFLAAYDPALRKDVGAYYTPVEVVRCQVRLVDNLLINRLNKPLGFANPNVVTLDPAVGTGTYLLGVIQHALHRVEAEQGRGAVAGKATELAKNLYGFEILVGPYAVSELRVSRALKDRGAALPEDGTHVYLTDTLENPNTEPPQLPFFLRPISDQHAKALKVKSDVPVIVCLGNPPYDRHEAATGENRARTGGWVRWGERENDPGAIFRAFLDSAIASGHGVRVHNLYNLYVYFWRWALWKVFEHETAHGPGVVSFISASSYIDGDAFCGMREHMRHLCDEIWILDLGGEGRGTRRSDNVFAIQTPVAIGIALRTGIESREEPAKVHYARIEGSRDDKLVTLDAIGDHGEIQWEDCPNDWQAPFRPAGEGGYYEWPALKDLMPWQQSGIKPGRTWVISSSEDILKKRWRALLSTNGDERRRLFKDSPTGRQVGERTHQLPPSQGALKPISMLSPGTRPPRILRYAYRSFDRQYIIADARFIDRPGPGLWVTHGPLQIYLTTVFTQELGRGPAINVSVHLPDLHHFSGRGAKDAVPLYRSNDGSTTNILPNFLEKLEAEFNRCVTAEDYLAYIYGVMAQPAFTARFHKELETRELRVPITKDGVLFEKVRDVGAHLLWLHTYGERFVPEGKQPGHIPAGAARCIEAIPGTPEGYPEEFSYNEATHTLRVGKGTFAPVPPDVYEFEVSGLKVVQSWLKYRMKKGAGRKSSPLDDIRPERWTSQFTTELLELLWVLEATLEIYPKQAELLEAVIEGPCFKADEFPAVPEAMRKPPAATRTEQVSFLEEQS